MKKKPTVVQSTIVAKSRLFEVEQVELVFSNGEQRTFERLLSRGYGAVVIVPMIDQSTVLLVREYAAGTDRYELGLPKGLIEKNEDVLHAANRELQEEVGHGAKALQNLGTLSLAPGYICAMTTVILATDLYSSQLPGDEPESLEIVPWKLDNLPELLEQSDVTESRSIAALFMAQLALAKGHVDD